MWRTYRTMEAPRAMGLPREPMMLIAGLGITPFNPWLISKIKKSATSISTFTGGRRDAMACRLVWAFAISIGQ